MRQAIRQLLTAIPAVGGRVFEPHAATAQTPKPFLVLREGIQDAEADWAALSTVVEVWPYASRTTFQGVDALAASVIDALHRARFSSGGNEYLADYLGTGGADFLDEQWDAITRPLRFRVFALGWLGGLTYDPDPVTALRAWVTAQLPEVHTDPSTWSPADATPGVYFRLVGVAVAELTAAVTWIEVRVAGHVIAPGAAARATYSRRLVELLGMTRRLQLSDGGPLFLRLTSADHEADPMRVGQIRLAARFGVLMPAVEAETLRRAVVSGATAGEVK